MNNFRLTGGIEEKNGLYRTQIVLETPDGEITKLDSGFVFKTEKDAKESLDININNILNDFTKRGVEIVAKDGITYQ